VLRVQISEEVARAVQGALEMIEEPTGHSECRFVSVARRPVSDRREPLYCTLCAANVLLDYPAVFRVESE
jgi:hypothetical protein